MWNRGGHTPVVRVTARNSPRLSLAALIAVRPGCRPRLIYRTHTGRRHRKDRRKGFTEADYASLLHAAHQQLAGPLGVVWDYVPRRALPRPKPPPALPGPLAPRGPPRRRPPRE